MITRSPINTRANRYHSSFSIVYILSGHEETEAGRRGARGGGGGVGGAKGSGWGWRRWWGGGRGEAADPLKAVVHGQESGAWEHGARTNN